MITIGKTHVLSSKGISVDFRDNGATEAVKRLVKAAIAVGDAKGDLTRQIALITLMETTAPFRSQEYSREWQVDAALFTETEEGSDTSGLRLCATPENDAIATLTRRVEELEWEWRPITDHPDQPCDVMFYRAEAEWISAKTLDVIPGMPDRERFEIGYWEDNAWHYACSNHEVFEFGDKPGDNLQDPTHWRPLPTPPKGEDHG